MFGKVSMSELDLYIIKRIHDLFDCDATLHEADIARYLKITPQTLNKGLRNQKDFFNLTRLGKLYRKFKYSLNDCYNKFAITFKREILGGAIEMSFEGTAQLLSSASSAIIIMDKSAGIDCTQMLSFTESKLRNFNIIVDKTITSDSIFAIEQWAYSKHGNFTDRMSVNVFESDEEPIAEMVGGVINGEFCAFIQQDEGFSTMSEIGKALLVAEEQSLAEQEPVWSLLRSPDARALERFRRQLEKIKSSDSDSDSDSELDYKSAAIIAFLSGKIASYEASESIGENQQGDFWQSLSLEIGAVYGDEAASFFMDNWEYVELLG